MRSVLKTSMLLWGLLFLLIYTPRAYAQSVSDHVTKAGPSDWISFQDVPLGGTTLKPEGSKFYRLVDEQQRISRTSNERYYHYAIELKTAEGVEENSNFEISFDPSYQKILIHKLDLIRDGESLNRLVLSDFDIYRKETDRDKLLYNGTLQTSLIIPDVRIGDVLDYSYTITGKNSALGPHYKTYSRFGYSVPVQRRHERILIHKNIRANVKKHGNPASPKETKDGSYRVYQWAINDLEGNDVEDNRPNWYYSRPVYEFSSFESWEEVGEYFAPTYKLNFAKNGEISAIAKGIKLKASTDKERMRMVLDYVHDTIRYTGIEIGSGGYIPRPAEQTLSKKFGDCKDMTVLIIAILSEMNIEAYPVLVDTDYRGGIADMIPSHAAFDHVLVRAVVDGNTYLLDGTRGKQLGDMDHLEQSSYGKGLLLESGNARLIDLELRQPEYYKDVQDTFDLLSDPDSVSFESITSYYGYSADNMNSSYINDGRKDLEERFLSFFKDTYPDIEQVGDMEITAFPELGKFTVKADYTLGKGWEIGESEERVTFTAYPSDVSSDTPNFEAGSRTMPYSLSHPLKSRHKLIFILDESWPLSGGEVEIENAAFNFSKASTFEKGVYSEVYTYQSKAGHIPGEIFSDVMADVQKLDDELGVELYYSRGIEFGGLSSMSDEDVIVAMMGWIGLVLGIALIGAMVRNDADAEWQKDQLFYPVKLSKFILLSTVSMGFYSYFWAYKNWRWLRDVGNTENRPILRSFFCVITNFSLLPMLGEPNQVIEGQPIDGAPDTGRGYTWYSPGLGSFLALLYLGLEFCGRIANKLEQTSMFLVGIGFISFIALIPAAMQINQLNDDRPGVIEKNSTYHWTTTAFIVMAAPILLLFIYGVIS